MFCLGGFCLGVFGKGGFVQGVFVRGVFVWGVFVLELMITEAQFSCYYALNRPCSQSKWALMLVEALICPFYALP